MLFFLRSERTMAYKWISTHGKTIPPNAVRGGYEGKFELFVARARNPSDGKLTGGKAGYNLPGCHLSYGGKEIIVEEYEVLTIPTQDRKNLVWEFRSDGILPERAIQTDADAQLYVARFAYNGTLTPGKYQHGADHREAYIGYGGSEYSSTNYEILCCYN